MRWLYSLGIHIFGFAIWVGAKFNGKILKRYKGQKTFFDKIASLKNEEVIWFHVASLGEYEQGKPVLDRLKLDFPNYKILLTFFSSSGYEIVAPKNEVAVTAYMPLDTLVNAKKFIESLNIKSALFVKYEFWYNHLSVLQSENIPIIYFASNFRSDQFVFKWYGKWFLEILKKVTCFFVQTTESKKVLTSHGIFNVKVSKDTRLSRVANLRGEDFDVSPFSGFLDGEIPIFGSTWAKDHDLIISWHNSLPNPPKIIIAPHELDTGEITRLISSIKAPVVKYSESNRAGKVMIIDEIGILKYLYRFSRIVYIGGGFGNGIHNTLEAAVYVKPMFFGPNYKKFPEAIDFVTNQVAVTIKSQQEFNEVVNSFTLSKKSADYVKEYFENSEESVEKIVKSVKKFL